MKKVEMLCKWQPKATDVKEAGVCGVKGLAASTVPYSEMPQEWRDAHPD